MLKCMSGIWAFFLDSTVQEDRLTDISGPIKSNQYLRRCCRNEGLHNYLWASMFVTKSHGRAGGIVTLSDLRFQRVSEKMQADMIEAIIGAVYLSNFYDPHLFPTSSDGLLDNSHIPPPPPPLPPVAAPSVTPSWLMLEPVKDESRLELMVKHQQRTNSQMHRLQGCRTMVGSSSGLYAAALFADAFLIDGRPDETALRKPMSPFFELMKRCEVSPEV